MSGQFRTLDMFIAVQPVAETTLYLPPPKTKTKTKTCEI